MSVKSIKITQTIIFDLAIAEDIFERREAEIKSGPVGHAVIIKIGIGRRAAKGVEAIAVADTDAGAEEITAPTGLNGRQLRGQIGELRQKRRGWPGEAGCACGAGAFQLTQDGRLVRLRVEQA
ncbi:hypothetical protein D3C73_1208070 [compost metagenome]